MMEGVNEGREDGLAKDACPTGPCFFRSVLKDETDVIERGRD